MEEHLILFYLNHGAIYSSELAKYFNPTLVTQSTKIRKTAGIKMNKVKVFATSNSVDRLSEPLKSRFSIFNLPEYSYKQFEEIAVRTLKDRHRISQITATKIAAGVWYGMKSKDIRDILKIGKLAKSDDEGIQWLIETHKKYSLQYNVQQKV